MNPPSASAPSVAPAPSTASGPAASGRPAPPVEEAVARTYADGARRRVEELCCPVDYDPRYLEVIPDEVVERDYGCGDPSRYLEPGETVLDLGSGTGKICFIAAQVVGPAGRVIGVDMTRDMLEVARAAAPVVAGRLGFANVEFRRGRIQDLALDLDRADEVVRGLKLEGIDAFMAAEAEFERLRRDVPMVADGSVDVVVSNCVLNLVRPADKARLFDEIFRVLAPGGRAVISDIVSDEPVPAHLQHDPELWSGCVSGALTEEDFLGAFTRAGFEGVTVLERGGDPWRTVEGIEFRSMTVAAYRPQAAPCLERLQAVIYRGPFREVVDDDGHRLVRGRKTAVCDRTFRAYGRAPYRDHVLRVEPRETVPLEEAAPFDCTRTTPREAGELKGTGYRLTTDPRGPVCGPDGCC